MHADDDWYEDPFTDAAEAALGGESYLSMPRGWALAVDPPPTTTGTPRTVAPPTAPTSAGTATGTAPTRTVAPPPTYTVATDPTGQLSAAVTQSASMTPMERESMDIYLASSQGSGLSSFVAPPPLPQLAPVVAPAPVATAAPAAPVAGGAVADLSALATTANQGGGPGDMWGGGDFGLPDFEVPYQLPPQVGPPQVVVDQAAAPAAKKSDSKGLFIALAMGLGAKLLLFS